MPDTVTLPISAQLFWGLLGLGGSAIAIGLIFGILSAMDRKGPAPIERQLKIYGLDGMNPGLFLLLALLWLGLITLLVIGLFGLIWDVLWHEIPDRADSKGVWDWRFRLVQLTALTTVLGGVIALPITLNKVRLSMEQTATAKSALFNTKITEAAADLHATRQVSRQLDDKWETLWEDDVVRRNAAIDRLEGLVREQPEEAGRVSRLLSLYVRELSQAYPPKPIPNKQDLSQIRKWALGLTIPRSDMENAVQVLGLMTSIDGVIPASVKIDLSKSNLQGMYLVNLEFNNAQMNSANLQGTNLTLSQLKNANLSRANLQGANFKSAHLQGAKFTFAQLQSVNFKQANLQKARLDWTHLQNANLSEARLQEANLTVSQLQGANLDSALLQGANLYSPQLQMSNLCSAQLDHATNFLMHLYTGRWLDMGIFRRFHKYLDISLFCSPTAPPNFRTTPSGQTIGPRKPSSGATLKPNGARGPRPKASTFLNNPLASTLPPHSKA